MSTTLLSHTLLLATDVIRVADEKGPDPEDVKAGWAAFGIFILLALAVVFLGFSLIKHLRKAEANKDAGAFGDEPVVRADTQGDTPGDD
ncbi:hypothetical protein [Nocardioides speluncae]|uniref:hypothetical protein n=1 Tax=Nocardioides speluncae TaxID=2670337 RepID=UPI000D68E403|nr:hypothetical protein [Nocardioides speluncae]